MNTDQKLNPDLLGLLASCRAAPADDTPRLVLADWLDEFAELSGLPADDARARSELIRIQVELARPTSDDARVAELRAAERRLLAHFAPDWLSGVAVRLDELRGRTFGFVSTGALIPEQKPWRFERGLLTFDLHADELTDAELATWFGSPLGAWTDEVRVRLGGLAALEELAVADAVRPYLGVWYTVGARAIPTMRFGPAEQEPVNARRLRRLLRAANFALVRSLALYAPAVEAGFLRLLAVANTSGLRRLTVKAGIDDANAAYLASTPLARLSALDVSGCDLNADGLWMLVHSPHLKQLVSLTAFRNPLGCAGVTSLAESPLAGTLNALDLQNTGLGDAGTRALARSPLLGRLHGPGLNLSMNPVGDAGAGALAACEHLDRFSELVLRDCVVSDAGAAALANSPHAANLAYLDLWKNRVGDTGAKALAASPHLDDVRELSLRDNLIGPKGAEALRARFEERVKV